MQTNGNLSEKALYAAYIIIVLFFILILRLWQLQILQGSEYRRLSEENRLRILRIAAPRGIIYDRNGIPLVKNSPYYSVSINPWHLDTVNIKALSEALRINTASLIEKMNQQKRSVYEPIRLKEGLTFKDIAFIEARISDFPGLHIDVDMSREYPFGNTGAHLIGYLGRLTPFQSRDPEFRKVPSDAFFGQWGIEKLYDRELRGIPGETIIEVDALGRELRLIQEKPPVKGEDLTLAMDVNLQKEAEESFGEKTGAFVALKPDTGEILALVSKPSFDPNLFAKGINYREWEGLLKSPRQPLLNRALQSQYPPGSTFKIVTATAGLEQGVIDTDAKLTCKGEIAYGRWHFGCWQKKGHGTLSLHRALVESCDVYFYEVGKRLGIDRIALYARKLGLGRESGVPLAKERQGLIPDTKWKQEKRKQQWYLGETFNAAIGQGYVAVTPLQMAVMMSIVANNGYFYRPSLLMLKNKPDPVRKSGIKQETFETVRKALQGVVNEPGGTGWASRSSIVSISGKTGTAQVVGLKGGAKHLSAMQMDHAWFVAFAPYERPEIALSVMVEHGGHGGAVAAPIAKRAVEAYIKSIHRSVSSGDSPRRSVSSQEKTRNEKKESL